ncbi:Glycerophosphoryl diester phosphodiesterase [Bifidobacterium bohemicum]|uniref:Glycerophosphoryl diester phosphodiesterase n=1 Tax=Bifidobacterium bohemicum DSM 22767 TaxID=1437606 RepID=A0A086ZK15_9BIFI|nr:glycerophosphodiester phosphodiesterase family protein [Bifidobacterium bohemicum]KFI46865.1 glycerophosphoryl diester phosphodiesterase [Bifidobacterium bohemicum DSM 22767]SCB83427.1 Glycerophosphoryl diester phosphodiesterase [Bifidobacterium bohemicum]
MASRQAKADGRHHLFKFVLRTGLLAVGAAAWVVSPRLAGTRRRDGVSAVPDVWYAHRGLHDAGSGLTAKYAEGSAEYVALARRMARKAGYGAAVPEGTEDPMGPVIAPENSLPAFAAACEAGFGIELDVRLTADNKVVVAHDSTLARVAGDRRRIADLTYDDLCLIPLFPAPCKAGDVKVPVGGVVVDSKAAQDKTVTGDAAATAGRQEGAGSARRSSLQADCVHVPLFADVLELVAGRVPIIVEYKIDHQGWDARDRELMERGDTLLRDYEQRYGGPYVVESFSPMAMRWYRNAHPQVARGQLAGAAPFKPVLDHGGGRASVDSARAWLAGLLAFDWLSRPDFIAYNWHGGDSLPVHLARRFGATPVSWTVRSPDELEQCEADFDRHIFEAFVPSQARLEQS